MVVVRQLDVGSGSYVALVTPMTPDGQVWAKRPKPPGFSYAVRLGASFLFPCLFFYNSHELVVCLFSRRFSSASSPVSASCLLLLRPIAFARERKRASLLKDNFFFCLPPRLPKTDAVVIACTHKPNCCAELSRVGTSSTFVITAWLRRGLRNRVWRREPPSQCAVKRRLGLLAQFAIKARCILTACRNRLRSVVRLSSQ